jgi:hypothetical protein
MEKELVPYKEALALRELGFDEPCVFYVNKNDEIFIYNFQTHPDEFIEWCGGNVIKAPTFSQAFRWFRENHKLHSFVMSDNCVKDTYAYNIGFLAEEEEELYMMEGVCKGEVKLGFKTPEKAEIACLKRLIEIVKQ